MKCRYLNKICPEFEKPCTTCMAQEIRYLRNKVKDLESRNNVKDGSIIITKDDLIDAQAEALVRLTIKDPIFFILQDELTRAAGLTVNVLFDKKE